MTFALLWIALHAGEITITPIVQTPDEASCDRAKRVLSRVIPRHELACVPGVLVMPMDTPR